MLSRLQVLYRCLAGVATQINVENIVLFVAHLLELRQVITNARLDGIRNELKWIIYRVQCKPLNI